MMLLLMFPTHLAVGYLIGVYSRYPVAYVVVGSAVPDLVDRPLYWLGITPFSHTLAHSLVVAVPVCAVLVYFLGDRGVAVAIGWLVHILTDFLNVLTTQGLSVTPYYVVYFSPPATIEPVYATLTVTLPYTGIRHVVHPAVLVAELVVLGWAVVILARRNRNAAREPDPDSAA